MLLGTLRPWQSWVAPPPCLTHGNLRAPSERVQPVRTWLGLEPPVLLCCLPVAESRVCVFIHLVLSQCPDGTCVHTPYAKGRRDDRK